MLQITDAVNLNDIYSFHLSFQTPYFFEVSFEEWKESFLNDIDGEERKYVMRFYLNGLAAIITEWLKDGCEKSVEEISLIIHNCIFGRDTKGQYGL